MSANITGRISQAQSDENWHILIGVLVGLLILLILFFDIPLYLFFFTKAGWHH
jgi:hypothetical protein